MRRSPCDNTRTLTSNYSKSQLVSSSVNQNAEYTRLNTREKNHVQEKFSSDNVVVRTRGFKPSDRHDPIKKAFLEKLTHKILHFDMTECDKPPSVNIEKLLKPASDMREEVHMKNKKVYASSYFYAPTHPTVEDQVELARRISHSLSDVQNMKSKGQSMYVNRKKRSVKWIHDGNDTNDEEESISPKEVPLKCMMNPCGKVMDIYDIQAMGEEVNMEPKPKHPEKLFDIVRDLNTQKGRGAEIFAKRRKRSEKWIVEQDHIDNSYNNPVYTENQETTMHSEYGYYNKMTSPSTYKDKPYYNVYNPMEHIEEKTIPFGGYPLPPYYPGHQYYPPGEHYARAPQRIYLREVGCGPEPDLPPDFLPYKNGAYKKKAAPKEPKVTNGNGHQRANGHQNGGALHANGRKHPEAHRKHPEAHRKYPETARRHPEVNCNYPEVGRNYPEVNRKYPEVNRNYPEVNRKYSEVGRNYPEVARKYPEGNRKYPDGSRKFPEGNRKYPDQEPPRKPDSPEMDAETDYTPVPVKQLIQEFEKTCRPVMQYKKVKSKSVPATNSHCRDIYRFFESYDRKYPGGYAEPQVCTGCKAGRNDGYSSDEDEDLEDELEDEARVEEEEEEEDSTSSSEFDDSVSQVELYRVEGAPGARRGERYRALGTDYQSAGVRTNTGEEQSGLLEELFGQLGAGSGNELDANEGFRQVYEEQLLREESGPGFAEEKPAPVYNGPKLSSYQTLTNYNTAPRGWDQSLSVYKPVKFEKPQDPLVYSDF